jgi:hypothetical protein
MRGLGMLNYLQFGLEAAMLQVILLFQTFFTIKLELKNL